VAFLFFNGAAGGLIWVALISGLTFFVTNLGLKVAPSTGAAASTFPLFYSTTMAYAFAYALTALIICRKFFPRRPPKIAGVLAVLLAGGWAIAPGIVLFFLNRLSWKSLEGLQPGNVFNVASTHDSVQQLDHLYCACGWLLVMVVINAKWFCRQARNFQPPTATPPPPVPNETAPAAQ
jgi:hypothetical protein